MNYKEKLKFLREEKEVTQEEVANILGISRSTYNDYENQISILPIKHINILCNYFYISVDYLFNLSITKKYFSTNKEIDLKKAGMRLKEFRKENKLTQTKLSEILHTTFSTIAFYEKGRNLISTTFLYLICTKYQISADYLLGRIDKKITFDKNKDK